MGQIKKKLFGEVLFKIISCFYYGFIQFIVFYEVIKIFTLFIIIFNILVRLKDYHHRCSKTPLDGHS